jgi:hypothetical protein
MLDNVARSTQHAWTHQQQQQQRQPPAASSLQETAFLQRDVSVKQEEAAHHSKQNLHGSNGISSISSSGSGIVHASIIEQNTLKCVDAFVQLSVLAMAFKCTVSYRQATQINLTTGGSVQQKL